MSCKLLTNYNEKKILLDTSPAVIHLESVKGCPFDCAMCNLGNTKPIDISMDLLKKLEPYFPELEILSIHGLGEPLLSNHLDYFVENSHKHKFIIHMNTTGELLSEKKSLLLSKAYGLSIRFSIHAGREETYKKIIGGNLKKLASKIRYLVDISKDKNHDLWFSYIVMKETIDEIEDFFKLANYCGIKSVRFMRLNPTIYNIRGVEKRNFKLKYFEQFNQKIVDKFIENIPKYRKLASEFNIKIEYGTMSPFENYNSNLIGDFSNKVTNRIFKKRVFPIIPSKGNCIVPWVGQLGITMDGDVRICVQSSYKIGNLFENDLQTIWNSKKMQELRNSFSHDRHHKLCGYCRGLDIDDFPNNSLLDMRKDYIPFREKFLNKQR